LRRQKSRSYSASRCAYRQGSLGDFSRPISPARTRQEFRNLTSLRYTPRPGYVHLSYITHLIPLGIRLKFRRNVELRLLYNRNSVLINPAMDFMSDPAPSMSEEAASTISGKRRLRRSCESCRNSKGKCVPSEQSGQCQRYFRIFMIGAGF